METIRQRASRPLSDNEILITIGASMGGTEALRRVLLKLPPTLPGIVVAQHMPPEFTKLYAQGLNNQCGMTVCEARNGQKVMPGEVYIAPGGMQMTVTRMEGGYTLIVREGDKSLKYHPSVDVLFESVAKTAGNHAIGIIMTGMGNDGARGLLNLRQNGAFTIGQDEKSCVVYGMPREAYNIGAVTVQSSLDDIPSILLGQVVNKRRGK